MSQSLSRALELMARLAEGPANLDELAAELGVHKTTVLRLLRPLTEQRFAYRDGAHRFHLGSRLFEFAAAAEEQRDVRATAMSHLAEFNRRYGRTTHLAAREGDAIVYIAKLESRDQLRMFSRVGMAANKNSTAVAKVILADLDDAGLRAETARMDFGRRAANTITDPARYAEEIAAVRVAGWAGDREENEPSINCIAAPVRDVTGRVVAAVSVSVPDVVLAYDDLLLLLEPLREVCAAISAECGYHAPDEPRSGPIDEEGPLT